jgi:hypothetical protein
MLAGAKTRTESRRARRPMHSPDRSASNRARMSIIFHLSPSALNFSEYRRYRAFVACTPTFSGK